MVIRKKYRKKGVYVEYKGVSSAVLIMPLTHYY